MINNTLSSAHKSLKQNGITITSTNPNRKAKVFDAPGGLRRKVKTIKWLSKKLMEYDIENDFWTPVEVKTDRIYLPRHDCYWRNGRFGAKQAHFH